MSESNPYLINDISTIIDVFTTPDAGEEYDTAEDEVRGTLSDLDWLKNTGGNSSWAAASERLSNHMDSAQSAVSSLYSYGTIQSGTKTTVDIPGVGGVEMQNTIYTLTTADNIGEAAATLVADCVPCEDRILALLSLNPLEDLFNAFEKMYQMQTQFVLDLFDLVLGDHSLEVFGDICSLFKFLNFTCLPDLIRIATVLAGLIKKYTLELKDIQVTFSHILGNIFGPSLSPLLSIFDRYMQLVIGPIECIVASLDTQLQRMDVVQGWQIVTGQDTTDNIRNLETDTVTKAFSKPLQEFREYLQKAVNDADEAFDQLNKDIRDALNLQDESDKSLFDITQHIEKVKRYIGIVQALIIAVKQGTINCGPESNGKEDLHIYLSTYVSPMLDVDIVFDKDNIHIKRHLPENIDELVDVLGTLHKESASADIPRSTPQVAEIVLPLSNCLYTTTDNELDKVREFLGNFQESE